jgi:hypothetical protein
MGVSVGFHVAEASGMGPAPVGFAVADGFAAAGQNCFVIVKTLRSQRGSPSALLLQKFSYCPLQRWGKGSDFSIFGAYNLTTAQFFQAG